jgi:hypothetical protein
MNSRPKRRLIVLAIASALATAGMACLVLRASGESQGWALAAAASPLAVRCLAIMVAGLLALGLVLAVLIRLCPARQGDAVASPAARSPISLATLHGDQGGTAAIEMAFVFPLAMMIFLLVAQAALLFNANMVVHYATFCAARMATVVVPLQLNNDGVYPELRNLVRNPGEPSVAQSEKLEMIRRAAVMAVMPVSAVGAAGTGGGQDSTGADIQKESASAFRNLGARDQRPWFFLLKSKPSFAPLFKRAKEQFDYADGNIMLKGGENPGDTQVTKFELMKPEHWRTPPEARRWNPNRIDGGFTDGDWDPQNVSDPNDDCPHVNRLQGPDQGWNYETGIWNFSYICPFYPDRMDYRYEEGLHEYPEDLNVRVTYQFLLEVPYANRFLGEEASVPGRKGKQFASQIRAVAALSNEGGPDKKPKDYQGPWR